MAASAKHLSFLFLLCLASALQIQARQSQYFSKTTRVDEVKEPKVNDNSVPSVKEEAATFTPQSKSGHGLYGNDPEEASPSTTGTPSKFPTNEFATENYEDESKTGYVNNEDQNKQYGMSDTRYLENGKYFYDVNSDRSRNGYQSWKGNGEELETSGTMDTRYKYNYGGYGNDDRNRYNYAGYENRERSKYNYGGDDNRERSKYTNGGYQNSERSKYTNGGYQNSERSKYNYGGDDNRERSKYSNGGYQNSERSKYSNGGYQNSERSKYNNGGYEKNENGDEFNTSMEGYQNQEEFEP